MESDAILRQMVIDELESEPSITAGGIGVAVSNGVVTLTGHVPTYEERFSTVRAAQRVRGVKAVAQELFVRLPNLKKHADDEIAGRAVAILSWTLPGADDIKVMVQGGWVTLEGKVDWGYQKQSAEQAIRRLGGVTGVSNTITVRPKIEPSEIRNAIQRAFQRNAQLEGAAVSVAVDGSTVTLSGRVNAWHERQIAEDAAWATPGVSEVRDRISIG